MGRGRRSGAGLACGARGARTRRRGSRRGLSCAGCDYSCTTRAACVRADCPWRHGSARTGGFVCLAQFISRDVAAQAAWQRRGIKMGCTDRVRRRLAASVGPGDISDSGGRAIERIVSHFEVQRLVVISEDFLAVQKAVFQILQDTSQPGYSILTRAERDLETAYVARLFSEFEGILRQYLAANDPRLRPASKSIYNVINRTASVWSIPDEIRDSVHTAREYRNSVVHSNSRSRASISFRDVKSILSKFLAPLP